MIARTLGRLVQAAAIRRAVLALWSVSLGLVVVLSVIPNPAPETAPGGDKLYHALAYLALGFGAAFGPPTGRRVRAATATIALGWLLEGVQAGLPWRTAELADGLVNTIAALAGAAVAVGVLRGAARAKPEARRSHSK
jgi:VanZ family protein